MCRGASWGGGLWGSSPPKFGGWTSKIHPKGGLKPLPKFTAYYKNDPLQTLRDPLGPKKCQKTLILTLASPTNCTFFKLILTHGVMWSSSWSAWLATSSIGGLTTMTRIARSTKMQHWRITFDGMRWGFNCDQGCENKKVNKQLISRKKTM